MLLFHKFFWQSLAMFLISLTKLSKYPLLGFLRSLARTFRAPQIRKVFSCAPQIHKTFSCAPKAKPLKGKASFAASLAAIDFVDIFRIILEAIARSDFIQIIIVDFSFCKGRHISHHIASTLNDVKGDRAATAFPKAHIERQKWL